MGKKSRSKSSGENWGHAQHESRLHKKIDRQNVENELRQQDADDEDRPSTETDKKGTSKKKSAIKGYRRSMLLSHDNHEKREEKKLKLNITKTKRQIEGLKTHLKSWDDVHEKLQLKQWQMEEAKKRKREEEENAPGFKKKRRGRLGPETWKLKGAARPAWEVYDFDTRYVDPHLKAHKEAREKARRSINAFHICKGKFGKYDDQDDGNDDDVGDGEGNKHQNNLLTNTCRQYLSLSMQCALLNLEAKKFKSAREAFLEVIDLEGTSSISPLTNARCRLMRMYLEANRPDSARRLWEKLPPNYSSVWIRYSAALLEYVSWNILEEEGSSEQSAERLLVEAIRANVYCAYYIAFNETFQQVMEYTDDVEDAEDGTLEQAIEYCNSEQIGSWVGTEGAVEWLRRVILRTLNEKSSTASNSDDENAGQDGNDESDNDVHEPLKVEDLEWESKLNSLEREFEENKSEDKQDENSADGDGDSDTDGDGHDEQEVDLLMFTGMFRTGMEMLLDAGEFSKLEE